MKLLYLVCVAGVLLGSPTLITTKRLSTKSAMFENIRFDNPVIPGDFADPSVIRVGNVFYATGTSSEWAPHFPIFKSHDLTNWQQVGYVFNKKPSWTSSSFWAPEMFYHQNTFYVYYVARKADGISCIGVATSDNPEKGFKDHGILLEFGKEAIDPFVTKVEQQLYITWKAYGLDDRPIELLGAKLSTDGLRVEGQPFTLLKDHARRGLEGQCLIKKNNWYYLFYSVGACCGRACTYSVSVARSSSIEGPYADYKGNPILAENTQWKCPGHGAVVEAGNDRWFYLYHAYKKTDHVYTGRQGLLDELKWDNDWPSFTTRSALAGADSTVLEKQSGANSFTDNFNNRSTDDIWQWDFRNADPRFNLKKGQLCLSGVVDAATNKSGTVVTVRPYSGNYEMLVDVVNDNMALKGLAVYGDAGESCGIGVTANKIQVWQVKKNERTILKEATVETLAKPVRLKIKVEGGHKITFFWSYNNSGWNPLTTGSSFYEGDHLPPWDRSPRPGLHHHGNDEDQACFSNFNITYDY